MEERDYILFEEYLSGTLSDNEKKKFEDQLATEKDFNQSFLTYKELSGYLQNKLENEEETNAFESNLKSISNNYFDKPAKKSKVIKFRPWQYAVAASVAILFGLFVFNTSSDPIYNDFANYNSISLTVRGESDESFSKAEKAFNEKDFKNAELYFNQILAVDVANSEIKIYKSVALIETNRFSEADKLLKEISGGTSVFKYKALWYLALSKLKQKDYNACKNILNQIPEGTEVYAQAKKLLRKL